MQEMTEPASSVVVRGGHGHDRNEGMALRHYHKKDTQLQNEDLCNLMTPSRLDVTQNPAGTN